MNQVEEKIRQTGGSDDTRSIKRYEYINIHLYIIFTVKFYILI